MPKTTLTLATDGGGDYTPVAERIARFYERYPTGRIVTRLHSRSEREVTFRALVFRSAGDRHPAATGWASEREGDGEVNAVACLENTETSAVGRALANLGFAARGGGGATGPRPPTPRPALVKEASPTASPDQPSGEALQQRADAAVDAIRLVERAEALGLSHARGALIRARLRHPRVTIATVERIERRLRAWVALRRALFR